MDGLLALALAIAGFLAFDFVATYGVDSREQMPDDHRR
jgi:hypothetical protein